MVVLSKITTNDLHGENSPYFDGWKAYGMNPYHHGSYSDGSCRKSDWIRKTPKASICTAEGVNEFKNIAIFQDYHGLPEFRQAVASFMGRIRGGRVKFNQDRIVMGGGAAGAKEQIIFCLADPIAQLYLFCMFQDPPNRT
ncbi:1-aminocyclopropane-1-carboxylate synthase 1-like [Carya illinoinensis]|uniref:1-aminocyclopropane-1-carboxylate synthase 1-like n=1 Tax=Carya illinoinensis TaxID=32201 RepID=UPI001C71F984|nr:1-aminocyclopropane-1-carboxylate synthase 1-like [Carya illinoinensis]